MEKDEENLCEMDCHSEESVSSCEKRKMRENILNCVSKSDGFFKSQQIGDPDLTEIHKREIANDLLERSILIFLQRYWKFIQIRDIGFFNSNDYEINFYLSEIRKENDEKILKTRVKNRRYQALEQMKKSSSYFSDEEMKKRNPFLFDQFIGQHLTPEEREDAYKKAHKDERFSQFLMNQFERNVENCLFDKQKQDDEAVREEDDEEEDESEEESELEDEDQEPKQPVVTDEEKVRLRTEFTNMMYEHFLSGKDEDFDYSTVDENAEYDGAIQEDLDAQDKYFDED